MKTTTAARAAFLLLLSCGCGAGTTQAKTPDELAAADGGDSDGESAEPTASGPAPGSDDGSGKSGKNACTGFELDLMDALIHSACEVPNLGHDVKAQQVKDKVTVTAMVPTATVAPGAHAEILVTFKNTTAMPLSLDFLVDPLPRFSIETYNGKTKARVDLPSAPEPKVPDNMEPRGPGEAKTARITIAANGTATAKVPWDASKMRWAPEKLKGSAPELGYPKVPASPLPKGKYDLRVNTPLINVFEGMDKEISAPRTSVDVK
jgi:hypothetical protein